MPNYEELYYTARNKYYQAIEDRNCIQRKSSELQGKKSNLQNELSQKQNSLRKSLDKLAVVQDAENKCRSIIDNEFSTMKRSIKQLSEEYKKIISSDIGVADIESIYADDIDRTNNDLQSILSELEQSRRNLEEQVSSAKQDIDRCNNELSDISHQLNNVGSAAYAQSQINTYYAQMKEYQKKWENEC